MPLTREQFRQYVYGVVDEANRRFFREDAEMSEGEYRVGKSFNPSGDAAVDEIKGRAAELIDYVRDYVAVHKADVPEAGRCAAIACTEIESAAMWAVKAVTKWAAES